MKNATRRARAYRSLLAAAALLVAAPAAAGQLELVLRGGSEGGDYYVALYRGADAFEREERLDELRVAAAAGSTRVVFEDLAPGEYLVSSFYDSDGDGELTRNFLGVPTEPYGFSRNARGRFGPPSFEAAGFRVGDGPVRLEIELR